MDNFDFRCLKFTVVCKNKLGIQSDVVSTLDAIRLNMTCGATKVFFYPYVMRKKTRGHIPDALGSNLSIIEVPNDLMNLKETTLPVFNNYVYNYRKVDEHIGSFSIWSLL